LLRNIHYRNKKGDNLVNNRNNKGDKLVNIHLRLAALVPNYALVIENKYVKFDEKIAIYGKVTSTPSGHVFLTNQNYLNTVH